jgi:hypothetical protein
MGMTLDVIHWMPTISHIEFIEIILKLLFWKCSGPGWQKFTSLVTTTTAATATATTTTTTAGAGAGAGTFEDFMEPP